jgi:hypothetical protein
VSDGSDWSNDSGTLTLDKMIEWLRPRRGSVRLSIREQRSQQQKVGLISLQQSRQWRERLQRVVQSSQLAISNTRLSTIGKIS